MHSGPDLFLQSFLIGLSVAVPLGPIGLLCIHRTLANGRLAGLASGLGAATADALYAGLAGFSLSFISASLMVHSAGLELAGGLMLCFLGVKIFTSNPVDASCKEERRSLLSAYGSTFILTLANPATILFFMAIFAGLGITGAGGDAFKGTIMVAGVFMGSAMWWLVLSLSFGQIKERLVAGKLFLFNRAAGILIFGIGLYAMLIPLLHHAHTISAGI
ncbi:MAG TPA: LysE family transporter [Methanotrichaceae archaeon]|nr:LysE family transporter [Methanotrichaceae archaeon]